MLVLHISELGGIPCTPETLRPLRELVKQLGRTATRKLVASFEAAHPTGVEALIDWVHGASDKQAVRNLLVFWIRAKLGLPKATP